MYSDKQNRNQLNRLTRYGHHMGIVRRRSYQPQMSRRSPHLEAIWPETAECSSMRRQTLHNSENKRNIDKETSGMMQVFRFSDNRDMLAGTY